MSGNRTRYLSFKNRSPNGTELPSRREIAQNECHACRSGLEFQKNDAVIEKLAGFMDENRSKVESALSGILPALLGAVMQNASTTTGAQQIMVY
jgi:hypothetical protein